MIVIEPIRTLIQRSIRDDDRISNNIIVIMPWIPFVHVVLFITRYPILQQLLWWNRQGIRITSEAAALLLELVI